MELQLEQPRELWIDPILKEQLDKIKKRVLQYDHDWFAVIDGEEGSGKSVLAMQIGAYLDSDFSLNNIVFNSDDFIKMIKDPKTKKGACIILDEAFSAANSRASLTEVNRSMIAVATEMRQKNLFVLFVLPTFFDLDRAFALWRAKALIHVYLAKDFKRGQYVIFPKNAKKELYLVGKKKYSYSFPSSPFPPCRFLKFYPVSEDDYRAKKAEAFKKRTVSNRARQWMEQRNAYAKWMVHNSGLTTEEIGKVPKIYGAEPLGQQAISRITKELEQEDV